MTTNTNSTTKQRVFVFIRQYIQEHGISPTWQEIAQGVDLSMAQLGRVIKYLRKLGAIEPEKAQQQRHITPAKTKQDNHIDEAIHLFHEKYGYPPTVAELEAATGYNRQDVTFSLQFLEWLGSIVWAADKPRGIHLKADMPTIQQWGNVHERQTCREYMLSMLRPLVAQKAPSNVITLNMPEPTNAIFAPVLRANQVYSMAAHQMAFHTATIEDLCGTVSDFVSTLLKIPHSSPQRGDVYECSIRSLIDVAARMIDASAILMFSAESDDPTQGDLPEVEQGQRAAAKVA